MPADIFFTLHAVERFITRHAPGMTPNQARTHLIRSVATRLRERTILGQLQYQVDDPRCVLVVKHDSRMPIPLTCVTVLPTPDNAYGWSEDENEIVNEWLADQAAARVAKLASPEALTPKADPAPAEKRALTGALSPPVPKARLPVDPERARIVAQHEALLIAASLEREREKTKRHQISEQSTNTVLRRCFLLAISDVIRRGALGDESAVAVLEAIQEVRAEFLQDEFLRIGTEKEGNRR